MKLWVPFSGTGMHEKLGEWVAREKDERGQPVWYTEDADESKCIFEGEVLGTHMGAKLDAITRACYGGDGPKRIIDFKTTLSGGDRFADPSGAASIGHACQLNIGRMLVERSLGLEEGSVGMCAWVVGKTWVPTWAPIMSEAQILAAPVGVTNENTKRGVGMPTVGELLEQVKAFVAWWEQQGEGYGGLDKVPANVVEAYVGGMPLAGQGMWMARTGEDKCRRDCAWAWDCARVGGGV
jgi:hypothetical protein